MKKLALLTFAIVQLTICKAQQFAFQMNFVDAVGNTDSLTLGYDITATDSLDIAFGEVNIISTAYTSGLDARAGNVWFQQTLALGKSDKHLLRPKNKLFLILVKQEIFGC